MTRSSRSVCPVNNLETSDAFPVYCFPRHFQGRDFARRRCIVRWSGREFVAPCILEQPLIFKPTHASFRGSRNSFSKKLGYEPKYRIPKSFCPEIDAPSFFDTTKRGSYIYMYERKLWIFVFSLSPSLLSFRLAFRSWREENVSLGRKFNTISFY